MSHDAGSPYLDGPERAATPDEFKQQVAELKGQLRSAMRSGSSVANEWFESRFRRGVQQAETTGTTGDDFIVDERWLELAQAGARYAALAAAGALSPTAPVDLGFVVLRALIRVDQAQTELLNSIDENVRLLRDGPFAAGRILLTESERLASGDPGESRELLKSARQRFYDALPLANEPIDTAVVQAHVALTCLLLDDRPGAALWLRRAHQEVLPLTRSLAEKTGNTRVEASKWLVGLSLALPYTALYAFIAKKQKILRDERARVGLRRTLPFIDMVAAIHNGLDSGNEDLPSLQLVRVDRDQFELRAVPAATYLGS